MKNIFLSYPQTLQQQLSLLSQKSTPAVVWEEDNGAVVQLTYPQLYKCALGAAIRLQQHAPRVGKGRQGEVRIGVCLPRNADYVISFLSIWFAGAVYVPISDSSLKRLQDDANFKADFETRVRALASHLDFIICDSERTPLLQTLTTTKLLNIADLRCEIPADLSPAMLESDHEAFIYCSSGTTGAPKIIAIPHEGISDRVYTVMTELDVTAQDCILQYTGFDFDPSLMEIFMALQFGNPLIMAPEYARLNPLKLSSFFEKISAAGFSVPNIAIIVPSMLKLISPNTFCNMKSLMTTGENIQAKDLQPWFEQHENLRIFTGYGPTETTWGATLTEISRDPICIHVTKPMKGIELELLFPLDGIHEILIGGNGQGCYLGENAEEKTQENWLTQKGKKYFRSHDGVNVVDGKLIYSGRIDDHIKYHGKWISLEVIDSIVESLAGVLHATTVSVSGTAFVFIFIVRNSDLNLEDLEQQFRQTSGAELFPTFFEVNTLKFNARGKRCRQLKDYSDAQPLTAPNSPVDPLALIWTQALAEIDLAEIASAFSQVGIQDYLRYLPQYAQTDRFEEFGGRSIKLPRLINLLRENIEVHSKQTFTMGILRHQSFQDMLQYLQVYRAAVQAFSHDQKKTTNRYQCLWLSLVEDIQPSSYDDFSEVLEAEIKARYSALYFYLITHDYPPSLLHCIQSQFERFALVEPALQMSTGEYVDLRIESLIIRNIIEKPPLQQRVVGSCVAIPPENPCTLLGTACGKTSTLVLLQEQLHHSGQLACYLSCQFLLDEALNLPKLLTLSLEQWTLLCNGKDVLAEITWLIDDIEYGAQDNRLQYLYECLQRYKGNSRCIYAGRENFHPYVMHNPQQYGCVTQLISPPIDSLTDWFQEEASHSTLSYSDFFTQMQNLFSEFKQRRYIRAETRHSWWADTSSEALLTQTDRPPLYVTQYPGFASFVRFLQLHDTLVYSIKPECRSALELCFSSSMSQPYSHSFPITITNDVSAQGVLPDNIRRFPGASHLSPWILFHSISGMCPEGYASMAEIIYHETQQSTLTIAMPEQDDWDTLEFQVGSYLKMLEPFIPTGASWYLGGWSYGGFLAVEAARQLEAKGINVAVVLNLDSPPLFNYRDFPWETYQQDLRIHLANYQEARVLLARSELNSRRLQQYCTAHQFHATLHAKHYVIEATEKPNLLQAIDFDAWRRAGNYIDIFQCEGNHFTFFSTLAFKRQLKKILLQHRELSDLRPLAERLDEKSQSFLTTMQNQFQSSVEYIAPDLEQKIHTEFLENQHAPAYLIVTGEAGVGKSRLVHHLAETLLRSPQNRGYFPIVFPLRLYLGISDINSLLSCYGLSRSDLRGSTRYLFIFDGFDESDLDLKRYPLKLEQRSKVIITVRKGVSVNLSQSAFNWELPVLDDKALQLWFSKFEHPSDIQRYFQDDKQRRLEWLRTPLALSMLLKIINTGQPAYSLFSNEYRLYEYIDKLYFQEYCSQLAMTPVDTISAYRHYCATLALQTVIPKTSRWNFPDEITQAFKKAAQLCEHGEQLTFSHITWKGYYLASAMLRCVLNFKISDQLTSITAALTRIKLLILPANADLVRMILDFWQSADRASRFTLRRNLFLMVLISRSADATSPLAHCTGAAMELLNLFNISLSHLNLARIKSPNCDLSGMLCLNTIFSDSDLTAANFNKSNIEGAVFNGALLDDIQSNRMKMQVGDTFCYSADGRTLIVADTTTLIGYDATSFDTLWRQSVSKQPIRKILITSENIIIFIGDSECGMLNRVIPELTPSWLIELKPRIEQICYCEKRREIALFCADRVELISISGTLSMTLSPAERRRDSYAKTLATHNLAFSTAATELAAIINRSLWVWELDSQRHITVPEIKQGSMTCLAYHPTRDLLFVGCAAYSGEHIICINSTNYSVITRFPRIKAYNNLSHLEQFWFNSENDLLISVSGGCATQFDLKNMQMSGAVVKCSGGGMTQSHYFQKQNLLAESTSGHLALIELNTGMTIRKFDNPNILFFDFHPNGMEFCLATADRQIQVWPLTQKSSLRDFLSNKKTHHSRECLSASASFFILGTWIIYDGLFYPHNRTFVELERYTKPWHFCGDPQLTLPIVFPSYSTSYRDVVCIPPAGQQVATVKIGNSLRKSKVEVVILNTHSHQEDYSVLLENKERKRRKACDDISAALHKELTHKSIKHRELATCPIGKFVVVRDGTAVIIIEIVSTTSYRSYWLSLIDLGTYPIDTLLNTKHSTEKYEHLKLCTHPSRSEFYVTHHSKIKIINPLENSPHNIRVVDIEHEIDDLAVHPNGQEALVLVATAPKLLFININTMRILEETNLEYQYPDVLYTHDGDYFTLYSSVAERTHKIQIWSNRSRINIHEIETEASLLSFAWLKSNWVNSLGQKTYCCAYTDTDYVIAEIVVLNDNTIQRSTIWNYQRQTVITPQAFLGRPSLPVNSSPQAPRQAQGSATGLLDIYLKISDYLSYRDYCSFIVAFGIPPEKCRERHKRPIIDKHEWRRKAPVVAEQLQRMGIFRLERAADLHHLKIETLDELDPLGRDPYRSVLISEENGEVCGEIDVYMLDDCMKVYTSFQDFKSITNRDYSNIYPQNGSILEKHF